MSHLHKEKGPLFCNERSTFKNKWFTLLQQKINCYNCTIIYLYIAIVIHIFEVQCFCCCIIPYGEKLWQWENWRIAHQFVFGEIKFGEL